MPLARAIALVFIALCTAPLAHAAAPVTVTTKISHPVVAQGADQEIYVQVSVEGVPPTKTSEPDRPDLNVALIIDRSGSMEGDKLSHAKKAAIAVVDHLSESDVLSVVVYDDEVQTIVPAQTLRDKARVKRAIRAIEAGDATALYAGTQEGAEQVRRFLGRDRVNRIILLSDGIANEGPSSPAELGSLGSRLMEKDGISVTTFGLGLDYNEDLMVALAERSDGNHAFIEDPERLAEMFAKEFGEITAVAAQDIVITITFAEGYTPVRLLGRSGEIDGQTVRVHLNQAYAGIPKDVLVEVEKSADASADSPARARVSYTGVQDGKPGQAEQAASVTYSTDKKAVAEAQDKTVLVEAAVQKAAIANDEAIRLRDAGKQEEAQDVMTQNAQDLRALAPSVPAPLATTLEIQADQIDESARAMADDDAWEGGGRKQMLHNQNTTKTKQSY